MCRYCNKYHPHHIPQYACQKYACQKLYAKWSTWGTALRAKHCKPLKQGYPLPYPGADTAPEYKPSCDSGPTPAPTLLWGVEVLYKQSDTLERLEIGMGIPDQEGKANKSAVNFLIRKGAMIINNKEVGRLEYQDWTTRPALEAIYYTDTGLVSLRCRNPGTNRL